MFFKCGSGRVTPNGGNQMLRDSFDKFEGKKTLVLGGLSGPVPGRLAGAGNPRFTQAVAVVGGQPLSSLHSLIPGNWVFGVYFCTIYCLPEKKGFST